MDEHTEEAVRLRNITEPLLAWYEREKRDLPWRMDPSAYHVWVSEIMLQQTRVEAVKPYYHRFLKELPTVEALAKAEEPALLKLWEGLGYYNRARNMQKAAKMVIEQYDGSLPKDYGLIKALPGIGSYTAGAICSIAFGIPVPAVDGNVLRVISRILARSWDIGLPAVKKETEEMLLSVIPKDRPGEFNQGLMELGATVCAPNGPARCGVCPLKALCLAKEQKLAAVLPVKSPKKPRRIQQLTVFVMKRQQEVLLRKRAKKGLLAGLYEFPNTEGYLDEKQVLAYLKDRGLPAVRIRPLPFARHLFTHVEWQMKGFYVQLDETEPLPKGDWIRVLPENLEKDYAIPSAFQVYLEYAES